MKDSDPESGGKPELSWHHLSNQAFALSQQGRHDEAISVAMQACELAHQQHGEHHPVTAASLRNLAGLSRARGKDPAAEPPLPRARTIGRAALGENHPHHATSLNNLGRLYQAMGNYARAEQLMLQSLEIRRAAQG